MKDLAKSLPQDIHILYGDLEDNPRIAEYFGIKIEEVSITLIL